MSRIFGFVLIMAAVLALALTPAAAARAKGKAKRSASASYASGCLPGSVKAMLGTVRQKFGPIRIVSTHRPGARILGSGRRSYHASCRAVDFHPPRGKYQQVVAFLKANWSGGVGTYSCNFHHLHIDNGPRVRFHKCQ